jgi:general secretion pathway protein B
MSYILEALKKSEHERGEKTVPRITSAPHFEVEPARRASAIYIAGGAVLLAAIAFVLGWMRPWQPDPAPGERQRTVAAPAQTPSPAPPREEAQTRMPLREADDATSSTLNSQRAAPESGWKPVPLPEDEGFKPPARRAPDYLVQSPPATEAKRAPPTRERGPGRDKAPEKAPAREKLAAAAPEKAPAPPKPTAPATTNPTQEAELETGASETPEVEPEPAPPSPRERRLNRKPVSPPAAPQQPAAPQAPNQPSPPPVTQPLPKPPERVLGFAELPPALQTALPKITISGKGQTSDSERIAVINDRVVREGDEIIAGLKLETIGENAVVLNYRGYRFYPAP